MRWIVLRIGRLNKCIKLKIDNYEYQNDRDDRFFTFLDLTGTQTYNLLLNVIYEGDYVLASVKVEVIYDKRVRAASMSSKVQVIGF